MRVCLCASLCLSFAYCVVDVSMFASVSVFFSLTVILCTCAFASQMVCVCFDESRLARASSVCGHLCVAVSSVASMCAGLETPLLS